MGTYPLWLALCIHANTGIASAKSDWDFHESTAVPVYRHQRRIRRKEPAGALGFTTHHRPPRQIRSEVSNQDPPPIMFNIEACAWPW